MGFSKSRFLFNLKMSKKEAALSIKFRIIRMLFFITTLPFIRKIRGFDNLPKDGPFIVAANHSSLLDPIILAIYLTWPLKRYVHFLSNYIVYDHPIAGFIVRIAKGIKVEQKAEAKSLFIALKDLQKGEIIGIFPEGTRSPDGKIQKGKNGAALLALKAKVPVVPVGLIDTDKVLPRNTNIPRFAKCEINIGSPLTFEQFYKDYDIAVDIGDQKKLLDIEGKVVRIVMQEIAKLSGQKYPF